MPFAVVLPPGYALHIVNHYVYSPAWRHGKVAFLGGGSRLGGLYRFFSVELRAEIGTER